MIVLFIRSLKAHSIVYKNRPLDPIASYFAVCSFVSGYCDSTVPKASGALRSLLSSPSPIIKCNIVVHQKHSRLHSTTRLIAIAQSRGKSRNTISWSLDLPSNFHQLSNNPQWQTLYFQNVPFPSLVLFQHISCFDKRRGGKSLWESPERHFVSLESPQRKRCHRNIAWKRSTKDVMTRRLLPVEAEVAESRCEVSGFVSWSSQVRLQVRTSWRL